MGSKSEFANIECADAVDYCYVCYYSETAPLSYGNYWHYNAYGEAVIW